MKMSEIRGMKSEELQSELDRLRHHLFDLRSQSVTEKLENPHQMTATKRDIARVLTVLSERGVTDIEAQQAHLEAKLHKQKR